MNNKPAITIPAGSEYSWVTDKVTSPHPQENLPRGHNTYWTHGRNILPARTIPTSSHTLPLTRNETPSPTVEMLQPAVTITILTCGDTTHL